MLSASHLRLEHIAPPLRCFSGARLVIGSGLSAVDRDASIKALNLRFSVHGFH